MSLDFSFVHGVCEEQLQDLHGLRVLQHYIGAFIPIIFVKLMILFER
jgi:hypothetical protein